MKYKFISWLLGAAILTTSLYATSETASAKSTAVTAHLNPDITIQIDNTAHTFYNVEGKEVFPIVYNNTIYLPLRSIGELMNKNVIWNSSTNTVNISGERTTDDVIGIPDDTAKQTEITFYLRHDITVIVDGKTQTFYDNDKKQLVPAVYDGSIYLPVHSIGKIMGKTVSWDDKEQTIKLNDNLNADVTDYDNTVNSKEEVVQSSSSVTDKSIISKNETLTNITLEQAKKIALNHAGKTSSQVTFVKAYKDFDDGRYEYEIEFITSSENAYLEYDYTIDAVSGKVLEYDYDAEGYSPISNGNTNKPTISEEKAKNTALARVPGATSANICKFKLDFDDGRWEYEGEIIYNQMEYDFTIDASSGTIIEWEVESIYS